MPRALHPRADEAHRLGLLLRGEISLELSEQVGSLLSIALPLQLLLFLVLLERRLLTHHREGRLGRHGPRQGGLLGPGVRTY